MKKVKTFWLSEPTLSISLLVIKGGTPVQADNLLLTRFEVIDFDHSVVSSKAFAYCVEANNHKRKYNFQVVFWDGESMNDLVHELVHLVTQIFRSRGIPVNWENDEIFAYHLAYWFVCITKEIKVTELPNKEEMEPM